MTDFIWSLRFVAAFDLDINTWLYKLLNNDQALEQCDHHQPFHSTFRLKLSMCNLQFYFFFCFPKLFSVDISQDLIFVYSYFFVVVQAHTT